MCDTAKNREKSLKLIIFFGLRSFKVIDVDILMKLITSACMISSKSVSICNLLHAIPTNSDKVSKFWGWW